MLSLRSEQRTGTAAYLAFTRPTYFYAGIIKEQRSKMEKDEDSIVGTYMPSSSSSNFDVDVIKVETSTAVIDAELGVGMKPKSQLMLPSSDKKQGSRASRCTRTVPTPGDRIQADVTAVVKRLVRSVEAKQQHDADEVVRLKLSEELQQGYRILKEFMSDVNKSVNRLFMDEVDVEELELWDYHERVKDPIWLKKMKQKFDDFTYQSITDFVADFRRMVENCLRYNGPDHVISKKANRLNTMLEQKLALLSWHVREKTSLEATSAVYGSTSPKLSSCGFTGTRKRKVIVPNDNSHLVQQLREEEREKKKQQRLQTMEEKRKATEAAEQEALDWDNNLLKEPIRMQMMTCWELPQICHFFYLTQEALNMPLLNTYELERCLAMPRESSMLAMIMTTLLCSPSQRPKLDRKPPMPYRIWSKRLKKRVAQWYKMLCEKGYDIEKVCTKFGFDTKLFDVLGECDPLEEQEFHELNYIERVWIVKSLCDYCLEHHSSVYDAIGAWDLHEQKQVTLGHDEEGNTYIHFPQFCGDCLRVYRQGYIAELGNEPRAKRGWLAELRGEPPPEDIVDEVLPGRPHSVSKRTRGQKLQAKVDKSQIVTRTRPCGLRQKIKPVVVYQAEQCNDVTSDYESAREDSVSCTSEHSSVLSLRIAEESPNQSGRNSRSQTLTKSGRIKAKKLRPFGKRRRKYTRRRCAKKSKDGENESDDNSMSDCEDNGCNIVETKVGVDTNKRTAVRDLSSELKHCSEATSREGDDTTALNNRAKHDTIVVNDRVSRGTRAINDCASHKTIGVTGRTSQDATTVNDNALHDTMAVNGRTAHDTMAVVKNCKSDYITAVNDDASHDMMRGVRSLLADMVEHIALCADAGRTSSKKRGCMWPHFIACCVPEAECGTESLICTSKHRYTRLKRYQPPTSLEEAEFVMVADSMEDLRELEVKFREKQLTTVKKGRAKKVVQPPPRQQCVVELHKRLCNMLTELGPWEGKLAHAARRARTKLRKEYDVSQMKINHHEEEKSVWSSEEEELENEGCVSDSAVTENGNDEENAEEVEVKNPADPCGNNLAIKTEEEGEAKVDNDHTLKLDKFTMVADSTRKRHLRGKRGGKMSNDQLVTSTQGRVRKRKLLLDEADNDDSSKKKKQAHTSLGEEDAGTVKREGVDRVTAKGVMNTNSKLTNAVCFPKAGDVIAQGDSTAVRTVPLMARNVQVQPSLVRTLIQRPNLAVKTTDARPVSPSGKTQEQKAIQVLVHGSGIAGSIPLSSLRTVDSGRSDVHVVGSVPLAMYQNIKTQSKPVAATLVSPATPQLPSRQVMQTMRPPLGKVYVPVYIGGKVVLAEVGSQLLHKSPPANINVNTASQQAVISNQPTLPVVSSVNTVVAGVSPILQDAAAKCNQADTSFPPLSATAVVSGASTRVIKKALTQVTLGSPVAAVTKVVSSNVNMPGSVIVQGANVASSRVILAGNATTIGANKVIGYESTHAASGISHGSKQSVATVVKTSPVINPKGSLHKICFGQVDSATSRGPRAATVAADKLYICNSRDVGIVRKTVPAHTASSAMVPGARAAPNVTSPIIQTLVGCVSSISDSSTVPSAPMPAPQAVMGCAIADAKVGQGGMKTLESAGVQGGSIVNVLRTCAPTYANTLRDAAANVNPDCRQSPNIATSGCADAVNTSWKNKTTLGYAMQASSSTSHMSPSLNSAHSPAGQRTSVSRKTGDVLLEDRPCETTAAAAAPDVHVSSPTLKQICQKPIEAGHTQQTLAFTSQASADTNSTGQAKSNVVTVLQPSPDGKMYVVRVVPATSVHNAKTLVQGSALNTSGLISSAQLRTSVLPASQKIPYLSKSFQSKPMPTLSTRISPLKSEVEQSKVGKGLQLKEKRSAFHRDVRETQNPDKSDVENVNIVGLHKQNCIIGPGATKVYKLEQTIAVTDKRSISANIIDQSRGINRDGDDKKFKHESDIKMEIGELGRKVVNAHTQFAAELGEAGVNDGVNVKAEPVAGTLSRHLEHSSVKSNSVHIASNGMQPVSAPSYHVNKQVPLAPKPVSTPIMSTSPLKIVPSMHVSSPSHVSVVRPTKASHAFGLPQFYSLPGGQVVTSQLGSIVSSSVAMPSSGSTASNIVPSTTTAVVMPRVASIGTVAQQPMTVQVRGQSAKSARQVIQGMRLPSGQLVTMKNSAPLPAVKDMQSTAVVQQPVSAGKSAVVAPGMNVSLRGPVRIILPPGTIVPRFGFASATVQRPLLVPRAATGGVGQIRNSSIVDGVITFGIPGQSVTSTRSVNVESSRTTTVRPAVSTAGQDSKPLVLNLSRDLVVSDGNVVRQTSLLQHTGAGEMRANATNTQELVVLQSQQGKLVKPVAQSTQSVLSQQSSILAASGSVVFTQK